MRGRDVRERGLDERGRDEHGRDERGRDERGRDERGRDERGRDERGRDDRGRDVRERGLGERGRDERDRDGDRESRRHEDRDRNAYSSCRGFRDGDFGDLPSRREYSGANFREGPRDVVYQFFQATPHNMSHQPQQQQFMVPQQEQQQQQLQPFRVGGGACFFARAIKRIIWANVIINATSQQHAHSILISNSLQGTRRPPFRWCEKSSNRLPETQTHSQRNLEQTKIHQHGRDHPTKTGVVVPLVLSKRDVQMQTVPHEDASKRLAQWLEL